MANENDAGGEALRRVTATEPPTWLAPNPSLSETARTASQYLFSTLRPFTPKSPLDQLLVDGFDVEQIWQQIDLQSQPLLSTLRRRVNHLAQNPEEISQLMVPSGAGNEVETEGREEWGEEIDGLDEELDDADDDDDDEEMVEMEEGEDEEEEEEEEEDDEEEEEEEEDDEEMEDEDEEGGGSEEEDGEGGGIEDEFLKIGELNKYLQKEEENFENGDEDRKGEDEDEDEDEDDDEDDDDEYGGFGMDDEDGEAVGMKKAKKAKDPMYEDFFGGKKDAQKKRPSTHEKELEKIQSKIEQMEQANIEPKTWTMHGEVTAAKRPKNSALEVDLDFEHNVRPAPVITEEVTASIEDMIKKRILEGHFNDVERASKLPSKAPRELKELDDNKSKQGLAELYEQEYVQKKDPSSAPLSFKDELKNEADMLFKRLCLKLDALSHFNFAPKPVIEDMSFQANVPALAMEEIAPVAVSDAAFLAPEEVFDGKGDVKEEGELTKEERKRRRANKKRKFKAEAVKRPAKKVPEGPSPIQVNG
ncbi:M phase phosphoprotein 10 [Lotus japonicus]|uniref:M phase phosphoprotein 10 n=1 Tax=Lotus japonicus TaxID=34305 RepID=UPI002585996E|nr:M phase phosphoprotein 10 [Lotus japonicus]